MLPRECVLREGDSGGLWCTGAPRFTARPATPWGFLLVILRVSVLAQGHCLSLACHSDCETFVSALPTKAKHECLQGFIGFPTRTSRRRRCFTWRRDLASPLLAASHRMRISADFLATHIRLCEVVKMDAA